MSTEPDDIDEELLDEVADYDLVDEDTLSPADLEGIVLYTLDWSVQSLLERIGTSIEITPSFQRRDAWSAERKSLYIESLMLGLPVPQVVLAEDARQKGRFIVLDGKQRLITLKQFAAPGPTFPALRLRRLEFLRELDNLTFEDLSDRPAIREYADSFLSQPVRTIVVRNWRQEAILYQIFVRLNQNSVTLSPQELRQALYPGPFTGWINERSAASVWLHKARRLRKEDFRMRDAEMLLRHIALSDRLETYRSNLRAFLDQACYDGNRSWSTRQEAYLALADGCDAAIQRVFIIFGQSNSFLRYFDRRYVRRFNISVFDALTPVLGSTELSTDEVMNHADALRQAFEMLSERDDDFQRSLVSTTKTTQATVGRIAAWGQEVERITGKRIPLVARALALR